MLNILQTGDLHLGKVLYEYPLINDQKHMLQLLFEEIIAFPYDALIITGDIYDRSIPSPEAVCLFDDFLTQVNKEKPDLSICIIPGNHDSSMRLSYASNFLKSKNIYLTTNPEDLDKPIILKSKDNEKVALFQIPFLHAGSLQLSDGTLLKNQTDLVSEAISRIKKTSEFAEYPSILNCHLFTLKGTTSDSERLFLGNAELINPAAFTPFLYTAIGHLHKKQRVTENAYYSGSPLSYSFSEVQTDKVFLRVMLDVKNSIVSSVEPIAINPLRKLVQIEARFEDFEKMHELKDSFIEFTCLNEIPIENIASKLRKTFPFLLSIKQKAITNYYKNNEDSLLKKRALFEKKEALPIKDILCSFLQSIGAMSEAEDENSESEWKDCIELFEKTAKEVEATEHETT